MQLYLCQRTVIKWPVLDGSRQRKRTEIPACCVQRVKGPTPGERPTTKLHPPPHQSFSKQAMHGSTAASTQVKFTLPQLAEMVTQVPCQLYFEARAGSKKRQADGDAAALPMWALKCMGKYGDVYLALGDLHNPEDVVEIGNQPGPAKGKPDSSWNALLLVPPCHHAAFDTVSSWFQKQISELVARLPAAVGSPSPKIRTPFTDKDGKRGVWTLWSRSGFSPTKFWKLCTSAVPPAEDGAAPSAELAPSEQYWMQCLTQGQHVCALAAFSTFSCFADTWSVTLFARNITIRDTEPGVVVSEAAFVPVRRTGGPTTYCIPHVANNVPGYMVFGLDSGKPEWVPAGTDISAYVVPPTMMDVVDGITAGDYHLVQKNDAVKGPRFFWNNTKVHGSTMILLGGTDRPSEEQCFFLRPPGRFPDAPVDTPTWGAMVAVPWKTEEEANRRIREHLLTEMVGLLPAISAAGLNLTKKQLEKWKVATPETLEAMKESRMFALPGMKLYEEETGVIDGKVMNWIMSLKVTVKAPREDLDQLRARMYRVNTPSQEFFCTPVEDPTSIRSSERVTSLVECGESACSLNVQRVLPYARFMFIQEGGGSVDVMLDGQTVVKTGTAHHTHTGDFAGPTPSFDYTMEFARGNGGTDFSVGSTALPTPAWEDDA